MTSSTRNRLDTVFLYNDGASETLNLNGISDFLSEKLRSTKVLIRDSFFTERLLEHGLYDIAQSLAEIKVRDLSDPDTVFEVLPGEINFEKRILTDAANNVFGIMYDGFKFHSLLNRLLPRDEVNVNNAHIIVTSRLFGTFDHLNRRYHARVIMCGYPSIISTTGIVEAPAKPREFYQLKQRITGLNLPLPIEELKEKFKGKFIDYGDERLTDVMKGYVLQAIFYHNTQSPFCDDVNCRLYNAHWQHELINAQLTSGKLCDNHVKMLTDMNR